MPTKGSLTDRVLSIPPQAIFAVLFVLIFIPYIRPVSIPIPVTDYVRRYKDSMDAVPQGGHVVLSLDSSIGGILETGGAMVATVKYYVNRRPDVKLIIWGMHYDCPIVWSRFIEPLLKDRKYGVDYVWFGYIPGADAAIGKLSDDIRGILQYDAYGKAVDDLPIMQGIRNANDIALLHTYDTYGHAWSYIGHWQARYKTKLNLTVMSANIPLAAVYFTAGQIVGFCGGSRGCAELERITGFLGIATPTVDALSLSLLYGLVLLAVSNIAFWTGRRRGRR